MSYPTTFYLGESDVHLDRDKLREPIEVAYGTLRKGTGCQIESLSKDSPQCEHVFCSPSARQHLSFSVFPMLLQAAYFNDKVA